MAVDVGHAASVTIYNDMKKLTLLLGALLLVGAVCAQNMKAFISHKAYCTSNLQPYIEFTFIVGGNTVAYAANEYGKYQADVEVLVEVAHGDTVVKALHYILASDEFSDSTRSNKPDFADIQNLPVPNGEYFLNFYLKDRNRDSVELKYIDQIVVNFPDEKISSSRISLYENMIQTNGTGLYSRYGYDLPPLYYSYVKEEQSMLPFALEIYNTPKIIGKGHYMKAKCYIENFENKMVSLPNQIITKFLESSDVVVILDQFAIHQLPSGNFNVVVELYNDRDSLLLINKTFFQRSNPSIQLDLSQYDAVNIDETFVSRITDRKVLEEYIRSLYPISTNVEKEFFDTRMKQIPTEQLQRFFYSFWLARNPNDPESAWNKYNKMVGYVQERFGSVQVKGYKTDRGRVYLQYGQPNDIKEVPSDPVTMPYEIWHYYYLDDQSNVKFVFYDPSLVGNDYELIHSNKYGERHEPNWKYLMVRKIQVQRDIYDTNPDDYFGGDLDGDWKYH